MGNLIFDTLNKLKPKKDNILDAFQKARRIKDPGFQRIEETIWKMNEPKKGKYFNNQEDNDE